MTKTWLPVSLNFSWQNMVQYLKFNAFWCPIVLIYKWAWSDLDTAATDQAVQGWTESHIVWFWAGTRPRREIRYFAGQAWTAWACHF